jgi:hypothetical protein
LACGDPQQAYADHQGALKLARAIHSGLEEARALEGIGRCAMMSREIDAASGPLHEALKIYQRIGAAEALRLASEIDDLQQT